MKWGNLFTSWAIPGLCSRWSDDTFDQTCRWRLKRLMLLVVWYLEFLINKSIHFVFVNTADLCEQGHGTTRESVPKHDQTNWPKWRAPVSSDYGRLWQFSPEKGGANVRRVSYSTQRRIGYWNETFDKAYWSETGRGGGGETHNWSAVIWNDLNAMMFWHVKFNRVHQMHA